MEVDNGQLTTDDRLPRPRLGLGCTGEATLVTMLKTFDK